LEKERRNASLSGQVMAKCDSDEFKHIRKDVNIAQSHLFDHDMKI